MVSMSGEEKYIVLKYQFSQRYVFFQSKQVLLSRILSGLAIYLQNDLNFS